MMKKSIFILTLAASIGLAACSDKDGEKIIATSSVGEITQEQFYADVIKLAGPQLLEQIMVEKILEGKYKVTDEEVEEEFKFLQDQYGDDFQNQLNTAQLTEETLRSNIKFNKLKEKATAEITVSDEEIQAYYDKASKELKGRHILVKEKTEADDVLQRLAAGEDFAEIAKELSLDTGSGADGGELDWFTVGNMVSEFEEAAYALELNTLSEPVQSQFGYHIIEITEKRDVEDYGTLEEKKDAIYETLLAEKSEWSLVVAKLVKDANIEIKDNNFSEAFKNFK